MIYHIIKNSYWKKFEKGTSYFPETFEAEGFIHLSKKEQVAGVLERYFNNETNLVLLSLDETLLGSKLVYEEATNQELFPHYYGKLNIAKIKKISFGNAQEILKSLEVLELQPTF